MRLCLPDARKIDIERCMSDMNVIRARKAFVLQDRKRLPGRFFARLVGAPTSRLG
jgi:hypothetical protein